LRSDEGGKEEESGEETMSYLDEAANDARNLAIEFKDEITEEILMMAKAQEMLHAYGERAHAILNERYSQWSGSLMEADQLLDELFAYEEKDAGLWRGLAPRRAVVAQAAYTYRNAVAVMFRRFMENLNTALDEQFEGKRVDWTNEEDWAAVRAFVEKFMVDWTL